MAKILCNYFGLSMAAEGKSEFVGRQAAAFWAMCSRTRSAAPKTADVTRI